MFAQRLKALRIEKNMVQASLAELVGVSGKTISSYEQGNSEPPLETLVKLAKCFGVSTDYLIGLSNYKKEINQEANVPLPEKVIELLRNYSERVDPASGMSLADFFGAFIADDQFEQIFSFALFYITATDDMWHEIIVAAKQDDPQNPLYSQAVQSLSDDFFKSNTLNMAADRLKALIISLRERYPNL